MDLSIKGKNAIVCASSQGLGKSAAVDLAKEGVNLAICSRNKDKINLVKEEIEQTSDVKVVAIEADLSSEKDISALFQEAKKELKTIDILINNNGGPPPSTFEELTDEDWQKTFNSTMMSAIRLSKLVLPDMKKNKWGRIINISSVSVKTPVNGLFLSNSIRMGVLGWAKALSDEVAPHGITVNSVCPGTTKTERIEQILNAQSESSGKDKSEIEEAMANSIPMLRIGEASDLSALITFLASEKASYMTGLAVQVDGGSARTFY
jgi:3-oxoacyl-[acyl-carrier protein] reductase|tara:strand:- start:1011 stop:1802 length:792 start_codon:yes stop_codon:yes gene_type:complete